MKKIWIAKVLRDTSETAYTNVYEKAHKTESGAKNAIKNIFGDIKTVRQIDLCDDDN